MRFLLMSGLFTDRYQCSCHTSCQRRYVHHTWQQSSVHEHVVCYQLIIIIRCCCHVYHTTARGWRRCMPADILNSQTDRQTPYNFCYTDSMYNEVDSWLSDCVYLCVYQWSKWNQWTLRSLWTRHCNWGRNSFITTLLCSALTALSLRYIDRRCTELKDINWALTPRRSHVLLHHLSTDSTS